VRVDGRSLHYDRLILATGGHVRRIMVPGAEAAGIHYVHDIADVLAIRERWRPGAKLVVIGGGYVGLEVAAVAVSAGLAVTVVEIADRLMARVVAPPVSRFYLDAHRQAGVNVLLNTGLNEVRVHGHGSEVLCTDGTSLAADIVVAGIGIQPAMELAASAGIECHDGIVVDELCRTSDPHVYAAGDCTNHPNPLLGRRLRLESVHNATEQGKTAALDILGQPEPYAQIPWFWSDQYDLKLQITGIAVQYTEAVIRGDPASRAFAVFYLDGDRLLAVHAINSPREFMLSKKLIAHGARFDPRLLADASVPFKTLAEAAHSA